MNETGAEGRDACDGTAVVHWCVRRIRSGIRSESFPSASDAGGEMCPEFIPGSRRTLTGSMPRLSVLDAGNDEDERWRHTDTHSEKKNKRKAVSLHLKLTCVGLHRCGLSTVSEESAMYSVFEAFEVFQVFMVRWIKRRAPLLAHQPDLTGHLIAVHILCVDCELADDVS